ncbi:MAG: acyclic terpene utilization AtuA family protein [Rhizobiaceae bacterium]|nr:acyclic terpene utilization AtuA family protein [Rhizobiaceae bacterium]
MSGFLRLKQAFEAGNRRPIKILGASGQLGYGIPTPAFAEGLGRMPDMIGCDMGSIDIGPNYLGGGRMAVSRDGAKRDLRKVLLGARRIDVPLIIGSAGSAGAAPHLRATLEILREIAQEERLTFRLAAIGADISPGAVIEAIREGRVRPMDSMRPLEAADVEAATHIVAQMGLEMFQTALLGGADVIVAGRACDTGIFAGLPMLLDFPAGLSLHLAKIVECASLCCLPGGRDAILATLDDDGFELESMNPHRAATPASVAAHSLYEQADPFSIHEPSGRVDLRSVTYAAVGDRRTRVSGAKFEPAASQMIKLEGARAVGYRAVLVCSNADPRFIAEREAILQGLDALVASLVCEEGEKDYRLVPHIYGLNGVMPEIPPTSAPREIGMVIECIAANADRALDVLRTTKQYLLHFGYPGRLSTAGNLAFPFTPPEIPAGEVHEFNVFHLMQVENQEKYFPVRYEELDYSR